VFAVVFPKILEPLEYVMEDDMVLTNKVCAVIVELTVKDPVIDWLALKLFEPVVA
jgi:hypothetical protein